MIPNRSVAATVAFVKYTGSRIGENTISVFVPQNGDPEGMSKAFRLAESEDLVLSCYASRFIRANRNTAIGCPPELHLDSAYRYELYGTCVHAWKLELDPPRRGFLARYPSGVKPAKERKLYNGPFQNAEWHAFFVGTIEMFIEAFGGNNG